MTTLTTIITTTTPLTTHIEANPPIESTIIYPNPNTLPKIITTNVEVNNKIVIQERSNKTKEEIIEKLDNGMDNYDIGKIYEIFGSDYNIKISPINSNIYENISTTINFSNCENILRSKNELSQSSILTVYQIEINNVYEQSLINDVEYAVFNENKTRLDLSVCEKEVIIINYQLNISAINLTKVNYYSELGIDIFNIKDDFFNDICYSYSEHNSDMILNDRVSDIYENYSICENNCEYDKINITDNTVTCKCSVKTKADAVVEPPNLVTIIRDSFEDSNVGVIKCYKLVFNFRNKHKNLGFWIFTFLILFHIPLVIYYFIYNIEPIKIFILNEMEKFHYLYQIKNPRKKTDVSKNKNKNKNKKNTNYHVTFRTGSHNENSSYRVMVLTNNNKKNKTNKFNEKKVAFNEVNIPKVNSSKHCNANKSELLRINQKNTSKTLIEKARHNNKSYAKINEKLLTKNSLNNNQKRNLTNINKINHNSKGKNKYSLIQIDANNSSNTKPLSSDIILDNYDFETAIKYDKRKFSKILYICLLGKDNIINIIFFKTPLDIQSIRICNFIFIISCDLAFNAIFYSNEKISDKYHYNGNNIFLFTIINNSIISLISSVVGLVLTNALQCLFNYRGNFEDVFKNEERKLRKNKDYKVNKKAKKEIMDELIRNFNKLKCKIIIFFISEFTIMLFFYFFVTAFCEVYKSTQINWIEDFFSSFVISFAAGILESFILAIFYFISLKIRSKVIYKIIIFIYNL